MIILVSATEVGVHPLLSHHFVMGIEERVMLELDQGEA